MATVDDLRALGYDVSNSADGVLYVCGFGSMLYVAVDDRATIDSLADPVLHAQRIAPPELTPSAIESTPVAVIPQLDPKTATLADVIAAVNVLTA